MYLKQAGGYFLVYYATFLKQAGTCFFGLLGNFSNAKNVCSKQAGDYFLIHLGTFVIPKMCVQSKREPAFLVY